MIVRQSILGRDTERLIAIARVLLAGAHLAAAYFDRHAALNLTHALLTGTYGLVGAGVLVTQSGLGRPRLAKALHVFDIGFAAVMILSPGGAGYFLTLATFCLLSSVIQWRWPTVLLTGGVMLGIYLSAITLGLAGGERGLIRITYLVLATTGLAVVSRSAEASRARLLKLARWSSGRYSEAGDAVQRVFRHAADILEAEQIVVFYQELDSAAAIKAVFNVRNGAVDMSDSEIWPDQTVCANLQGQPFLLVDPGQSVCLTYDGMRKCPNPTPALPLTRSAGIVASAPLSGDFCQGRLFACGIRKWRWEQLVLVEIVASHVRSRLEGRLLRDRAARVTAELERMRLSRDLHDGILQSLTAARLQLRSIMKGLPPQSEDRIQSVADLLQDEQQKLREFIEDSRAGTGDLVAMAKIAERIRTVANHWRLQATIDMDGNDEPISFALYREIYFMVGEAVANSARHGHATGVRAQLRSENGRLIVTIDEENGREPRSIPEGVVPRSIDERIRALGGSLTLVQGTSGACLRLEIPLNA